MKFLYAFAAQGGYHLPIKHFTGITIFYSMMLMAVGKDSSCGPSVGSREHTVHDSTISRAQQAISGTICQRSMAREL